MKLIGVLVVGVLAALGTEMAAAMLLRLGPADWPMINSYWTFTALPAIGATVVLCTLLLWGVFKNGRLRYPLLFTIAYLLAMGLELHLYNNPPENIARFTAIAALVCTVILGSLYRLVWRYQPIP
ncbi:MAG: hypothetical protein AB8B93_08105 [Pseudomonadales bacterium]